MEHSGLINEVGRFLAPALIPSQVQDAYYRVFQRAISSACGAYGISDEAIADQLISRASPMQRRALFTPHVQSHSDVDKWTQVLADALEDHPVIDLGQLDIHRFSAKALERYRNELQVEASIPRSQVAHAFQNAALVSLLPGAVATPPPPEESRISNLWDIPAPRDLIPRPEVDTLLHLLSSHDLVGVVGGPGVGKSSVVHMAITDTLAGDDELSLWWCTASHRETLEAHCAGLCSALGSEPGDEVLTQTKALLARSRRRWLIIVDDLYDLSLLDEVIPRGVKSVKVVFTSRAATPAGIPRSALVPVAGHNPALVAQIAEASLAEGSTVADRAALIARCDGNPLVTATLCRFATATGTPVTSVLDLLDSHPERLLDENLGPEHPETFTALITSALQSMKGTITADVLALISLCGGQLASTLLADALPSADALALAEAQRRLNDLGLIESEQGRIGCHALIASVVTSIADKSRLHELSTKMLRNIEDSAFISDRLGLLESVRLVDQLQRSGRTPGGETEFAARTSLASALSAVGMLHTASRQLEHAETLASASSVPDSRSSVLAVRALLLVRRGHSRDAEEAAHRALASPSAMGADAMSPRGIEALAIAAMVLAWCRTYSEDWAGALEFADLAVSTAPQNSDIHAFRRNLLAQSGDPRARLQANLEIGADLTAPAQSRSTAFMFASRAALDLERWRSAVDFAEEACKIDEEAGETATLNYAATLNDLGMALIEVGDLERAEQNLRRSISIYEEEAYDNGLAAPTRTHLARLLVKRAPLLAPTERQKLLSEALDALSPAEGVLRAQSPLSPDFAALLVAKASIVAWDDPRSAVEITLEALEIDRALFGDADPEVAIDVKLVAERQLSIEDASGALDALRIIRPFITSWERERPGLAVGVVTTLLRALLHRPSSAFSDLEIHGAMQHLTRLVPVLDIHSPHRREAERLLAHVARSRDSSRLE